MTSGLDFRMFPVYVLPFLLFSHLTVLLLSAGNGNGNHDGCPTWFDCGNIGRFGYPFTKVERKDCGTFPIYGCDDHNPNTRVQLKIENTSFEVRKLEMQGSITIVSSIDQYLSKLLQSDSCKIFGYNINLPPSSALGYFYINNNITLFKCNRSLNISTPKTFLKNTSCADYDIFFGPPRSDDVSLRSLAACSRVQLPMNGFAISENPFAFLTAEIPIQFQPSDDCSQCLQDKEGHCRLDNEGKFYCAKVNENRRNWNLKIGFGVVIAVAVMLLLVIVMVGLRNTRWKKQNPTHLLIEAFLERHGPLQIRRYSYSEIKKVTNSFKNKLGQGGFGSVCKGNDSMDAMLQCRS